MHAPKSKTTLAGQVICLLMIAWPTATTFHAGKTLNTAAGIFALAGLVLWSALDWTRDSLAATNVAADGRGVEFTATRAQRIMVHSVALCFAISLIMLGYLQLIGQISWIPADGHYGRHGRTLALLMPVILPITGLLCLPAAVHIIGRLASLDEPHYIRVQPDGLHLAYRKTKIRIARWDDIAALPGGFTANGRFIPKVRLVLNTGRMLDAPVVALTDGCTPINAFIHLYWSRPDLRDELTDGRALRRYRAGDLSQPAAQPEPTPTAA